MLSYNVGFEKTVTREKDLITKVWGFVSYPQYTPEQLDLLGAAVEVALGEHFVSFEVDDQMGQQLTTVSYHGEMIEDVETDRNDLLDSTYQTWYLEQMEA